MTFRLPLCALVLATTSLAGPALAATLQPTGITTSTPAGSTSPTAPFTDDLYLDTLTFGSTVYDGTTGSFSVAKTFEVTAERSQINADWGDTDTDADGDADPFTKAGFPGADKETQDPEIQDAALLNAFNSRSLTETSDGEGRAMEFVVSFTNSLSYDAVGGDGAPDLVFFERGGNDSFAIELMIGGPVDNPTYSSALQMNSADFLDTGIAIDTTEIGSPQNLFVGGFDFSDWGIGAGTTVGGFRLTSSGGPDLGGFFLSAENAEDFGDPFEVTAPVPVPASMLLLLGGLGGFGALRARRRA